ncbi:hypothetical protein XENTR_v10002299 [Xenopus tropicalis]|nr:hypothetical protein XENTR_v10002299 [Xenopus tropicalis]
MEILWFGKGGMCWDAILPNLWNIFSVEQLPHIILIHVGGNDLGVYPMKNLIKDMRRDLRDLLSAIQGLILVWLEIIPRNVWRYASSHKAIDRTRIQVNREMSRFIRNIGGIVVRHKNIEYQDNLLGPDGVHFNDIGLDFFNLGLQEGLEEAFGVWKKMNG